MTYDIAIPMKNPTMIYVNRCNEGLIVQDIPKKKKITTPDANQNFRGIPKTTPWPSRWQALREIVSSEGATMIFCFFSISILFLYGRSLSF